MLDTCVEGGLLGDFEDLDGCGSDVLHLIAGEETAEVQGLVGKVVVDYPTAHFSDHLHIVVDGGDEEVGQLYPHTSVAHGEDSVEYGLQVAPADALIDVVAE